ncbi:MAG TPA: multiheme c-type cytochrome [Pirellulaceae bacterium]|jgi:predicted CXXCH cytochrome family protein
MPREESIVETGKQRSLRVPLDHYRRPNPLVRGKYWLSAIFAVVAVAYVVWLMLPTAASQQHVSPGPLAAAHASWNNDCAACHQYFQPLRSDAVSVIGLFRSDAYHRESLDQACIKCHNTPIHHASAKPGDVPSCATCHRDHRGPTADIVRASDTACLGCHRDLESHRNGQSGLKPPFANIRSFALTPARRASEGNSDGETRNLPHPDFRSLESDPGNIKFNHWLHLQPGISPAESKKKLKASDLPATFQKQYAPYAKPDGLVQLDCAACHEPDRDSAYMRPIAFEQHCQACHSLDWKFADDQPASEVPHGLTNERLAAVLDGLVFAAEAKRSGSRDAIADETGNLPLIPGKTLGKNLAEKISQDVLGRRNAAARAIATKCQECHIVDESKNDVASDLPSFRPANIPTIWLSHAKFDHSSHRHVECRTCHAASFAYEQHDKPQFVAVANGASAARDHEQVMIAGLESCANCHAPAGGKSGGARFDCAECHKYHGGDTHVSSFPGSPLGTHHPEAPASSAPPSISTIRLASFSAASLNAQAFAGASTCTSTGCHGNANANSPAWQSAFDVWASRDPHAEAFNVLWTFRGREMTRQLSQLLEPLTDHQHLLALEQRCIGCHATPAPEAPADAAHLALGVQCESCHGPAGQWLHAHYQGGYRRHTSGFIDTKDLNQRAETCLKCHAGPSDATGSPQAVDHDLIAAGHPKLSFEFRTYFESLPAHWDRPKDQSRFPDSFYLQSWLTGQNELSTWRTEHAIDPSADFAQLECSVCHHTLAPNARNASQRLRSLPPAKTPIAIPSSDKSMSVNERLALAQQLLIGGASNNSWDDALNGYLATGAITADQPIRKMADWPKLLGSLSDYLARDSFPADIRRQRNPSPYDSPSDFDPATWKRQIETFIETLHRLESTNN